MAQDKPLTPAQLRAKGELTTVAKTMDQQIINDENPRHDDPAVQTLIDNGWLGEWDCPLGLGDLMNAVELVRATDAANGRSSSLAALAEWLVSLDDPDPDSPAGMARRTVTMTQIIDRARAALDEKGEVRLPLHELTEARCPHGCGLLQWVDDSYYCPKCGDEWDYDNESVKNARSEGSEGEVTMADEVTALTAAERAALTVVAGCPQCQQHGPPLRMVDCGPDCHEAHTMVAPCTRSAAASEAGDG